MWLTRADRFTSRYRKKHFAIINKGSLTHPMRHLWKTSRFVLRLHVKVHYGSSKIFTSEFGKFFQKADYKGHRNSKHLNYKPFICEKCLEIFPYWASFVRYVSDCKRKDKITCGQWPSLLITKNLRKTQQSHLRKTKFDMWLRSCNRHISYCNYNL